MKKIFSTIVLGIIMLTSSAQPKPQPHMQLANTDSWKGDNASVSINYDRKEITINGDFSAPYEIIKYVSIGKFQCRLHRWAEEPSKEIYTIINDSGKWSIYCGNKTIMTFTTDSKSSQEKAAQVNKVYVPSDH